MNLLPGWMPFVSGKLTTLVSQDGAYTTTTTLTLPVDVVSGDLIIIGNMSSSSASLPIEVVPDGYTLIASVNDASITRFVISYKIASGTDSGANVTLMDGTVLQRAVCKTFRGNTSIKSVNVGSIAAECTAGNPAAQVIDSSVGTMPLLVCGVYQCQLVLAASMSPAEDGSYDPSTHDSIKWKIYNSGTPVDVTVDDTDVGFFNCLASFYVECS